MPCHHRDALPGPVHGLRLVRYDRGGHRRPASRAAGRLDHDPDGPLELKTIEECFSSLAEIWHVHARGQVIRTTDEHPFCIKSRGWTETKHLRVGDVLVSHNGAEVVVEDLCDAGEIATAYNFRVADYHTMLISFTASRAAR